MDLMNNFLNILLSRISLTAFFVILPAYLIFKFLSYIIKSIFSEDVDGKVVLITGASSGIGEVLPLAHPVFQRIFHKFGFNLFS